MEKVRVLLITSGCPTEIGGVERVVSHILDNARQVDDIEVGILCIGGADETEFTNYAVSASGRGPIYNITFGYSFRTTIQEIVEDWDVFHFHLRQARDPLLFAPKDILDRTLVTMHTTEAGVRENIYQQFRFEDLLFAEKIQKLGYSQLNEILEHRTLQKVPYITTTTISLRSEIEYHYDLTVDKIINNGIKIQRRPTKDRPPCGNPTGLFVGRLTPQKGIFRAIDVISAVEQNIEWRIVGDGPYMDMVRQYCNRCGVSPTFLGSVAHEELKKIYTEVDFLLMTSYYEGLPMTGLEAAAGALPIVACKSTNLDDVVASGNQQFILPNGEIERLATAVDSLIDDRERAWNIGQANRERMLAEYTADQMATEYFQTYREFSRTICL
jgi:glycosyltransferase involved in cell wall biosynthesis